MVRDRLLTVIPRLSTEWIVSFTVRMTSLARSYYFCNVILLTNGGLGGHPGAKHGERTPLVSLPPLRDNIYISSSINSNDDYGKHVHLNGLVVNVSTHTEIHQRYTSGGKYRYFIKINGEEIFSIINANAQQFYDVKVYASDPWEDNCSGYIKNLEVTNFL